MKENKEAFEELELKIVYVEAVYMANGELIHMGKTLGFADTERTPAEADSNTKVVRIKVKGY